jgi:FkbM family methyltransferase
LGFDPQHIVDVGAHEGAWTRSALQFFPDAHYSLFEPQRDLLENQLDLDLPNINKHYLGVGAVTEERLFTVHSRRDSYSFSLSAGHAKKLNLVQTSVPVVTLDEFFLQSGLPAPDVLKVDAEGWDLEVLDGAKTTLGSCKVVLLEAGLINSGFRNNVLRVMQTMDSLGFTFFDITDLNRTPTGRLLWNVELAFTPYVGGLKSSSINYE